MADAREQVDRLLSEHKAVLKRHKKHQVWEFPDGKIFIRSGTPSDTHADGNNLSELKRILRLHDPERGMEGERRERKTDSPPAKRYRNIGTLADQLRVSGVEEEGLRSRIEDLERDLANARAVGSDFMKILISQGKEIDSCLGCRIRGWFRGWFYRDQKPSQTEPG